MNTLIDDIPTKFQFIWQSRFRGVFFLEIDQPQTIIDYGGHACLLADRNEMNNLYRGPSLDALYQVSVHLAKWF